MSTDVSMRKDAGYHVMATVTGRLVAAVIGVALVFYLTFASNSVEHASAEAEKAQATLTPDQVVVAYQALADSSEVEARARYFADKAVVHPESRVSCDPGAATTTNLAQAGGELVIRHRRLAVREGAAVEIYRVKDNQIVEYWRSVAGPAGCEGEQ